MNRKGNVRFLCEGAAIGGLYAALTMILMPISFGAGGAFQLRVAEALTLLPVFTSSAVPGLFVGCLAANLLCGAPLADIAVGSLATLLAAALTRKFRKNRYLAALMPVLCNTALVGGMLSVVYGTPLWFACFTVALGEIGACFLLGLPLCRGIEKLKLFQ